MQDLKETLEYRWCVMWPYIQCGPKKHEQSVKTLMWSLKSCPNSPFLQRICAAGVYPSGRSISSIFCTFFEQHNLASMLESYTERQKAQLHIHSVENIRCDISHITSDSNADCHIKYIETSHVQTSCIYKWCQLLEPPTLDERFCWWHCVMNSFVVKRHFLHLVDFLYLMYLVAHLCLKSWAASWITRVSYCSFLHIGQDFLLENLSKACRQAQWKTWEQDSNTWKETWEYVSAYGEYKVEHMSSNQKQQLNQIS